MHSVSARPFRPDLYSREFQHRLGPKHGARIAQAPNDAGVRLADVEDEIEVAQVDGVRVNYLSPRALLRTKQSIRPEAIATYAAEMAGTAADLDEGLDRAAIEHPRGRRRKR